MKKISAFIIILSFFSCHSQDGNPMQNQTPGMTLQKDTLHLIREFKGLCYINGDQREFISCDNPEMIHLLENNSHQVDTLYKSVLPNAYKGEAIFLDMKAEINMSPDKSHADLLIIKEFIKAEQKSSLNTCIPYDFWCTGTEPFWQLEISEKENLIDFYDPMSQATSHFAYKKPIIKDGTITYSSENPLTKTKINITVKNEKCSDGMSDKAYNYSVEINLNGSVIKGCGVKFGEKLNE